MNSFSRLNFDAALLDTLAEGVILLDRQAQVIAYNQAAQPWLKQTLARAAAIKNLLDLEVKSRVKLPVKLGHWQLKTEAQEASAQVWLLMNGRRDYAIYIAPCAGSTGVRGQLDQQPAAAAGYLMLLGEEVRAQLNALRLLLSPQAGVSMRDSAAIATQSQRAASLLQQLSDLSLLLQRDEIFADERLDLPTLVRAGFPADRASPEDARFELTQESAVLGAVYGHSIWMSYALRVLFEALQRSAPVRSLVTVALHQLGSYVVTSARVSADTNPRKSKRQTTSTANASPANPHQSGGPTESHEPQVHWLMCQRILTLHGGLLKLETLPTDDPVTPAIESFTLTLATGLPLHERARASCSSCRHVLQAQSYAKDLAQLLPSQ